MSAQRFTRRHFLWLVAGSGVAGWMGYAAMRRDLQLIHRRGEQPLPQRVGDCEFDPDRLTPLRECMQCYGPARPTDEWNHSCIHPRTVAYSCGQLAYPGGPNEHSHDPEEIDRCRRLAHDVAGLCRGLEVNASEGSSSLGPFFITAQRRAAVPDQLTPDVVRTAFGGTIYPAARIMLAPLEVGSRGWQEIADNEDGELHLPPRAEANYTREQLERLRQEEKTRWEAHVGRWRAVLAWFRGHEELHGGAFVLVGEDRLSGTNFCCVFPRLVLGITRAGSLVGVCGHAVQT